MQRMKVALPLLFLGILMSLSFAYDVDDTTQMMDATQVPQTTAPAQNPEAERLAVYKQINEEYLKIKPILEYSCFDCHSNKTEYPWYHVIPGVKGLIDEDVEHGLKHLDLSVDFPFIGEGSQIDMLREIKGEVESGNMPLLSYRLMHWCTKIEGAKQDSLFQWIDSSIVKLKTLKGRDDQDFE
jgi:hypothetical protein